MALAIRALRSAVGATIDEQHFPHDAWTIVDALTPALERALQPHPVHGKPELEVVELDEAGEPISEQYFPLVQTKETAPESADDGLDAAGFKTLVELGATLGLTIKPGTRKTDAVAAIRDARRAQAEKSATETE